MKLISTAVWKLIQDELETRREESRKDRERIDRLTEAICRKADIPAFMPPGDLPKQVPNILEKSQGWFDKKPIPALGENGK